jgi:hypothetical protein
MIHKLTYRRHNHDNIHVRGYKEEGTTTTPFDMVVLNNLDRYQLALDAIKRIPRLADQVEKATARYWTTMERHKLYISEHGDDMPEVATGAGSEGIQRYGFHGLSCESIVRQLGGDLPERLIIAHLGNGASVTAVRAGKSIDTSMGLTPTGGVIMGTRSGDLDPGVLIYLAREEASMRPCWKNWSITAPGCSGFRASTATCGVCMKPRRPTPMRGSPSRCSAIPCASRSPR